ncbi:hypothetical protein PVK06_012416 [Gossypium arboreum]|uniref:Uncharacterized protein n=1 Tax=Gossypium arboreum TaxID=29729 RepID=A0ABR0QBA6_GOSAR|nr:hypothetical protein PVK06_012416 [Gossypium arboreum]
MEEVVHDVSNLDPNDQFITDNHLELNLESRQEFRTRCKNELNINEDVFDPNNIDIVVELEVNELQPILNESVDEPIYFLAITENVLAKEIDEFISFLFNDKDKAQTTKTSRDMERRKLDTVIPQRIIWGWDGFYVKWLVM